MPLEPGSSRKKVPLQAASSQRATPIGVSRLCNEHTETLLRALRRQPDVLTCQPTDRRSQSLPAPMARAGSVTSTGTSAR